MILSKQPQSQDFETYRKLLLEHRLNIILSRSIMKMLVIFMDFFKKDAPGWHYKVVCLDCRKFLTLKNPGK